MSKYNKEYRDGCSTYMRQELEHLEHLSDVLHRGKTIKLWMHRSDPGLGVAFCTEKPEPIFKFCGDGVLFNLRGEFVAGDPIYSMKVLFPKVALYEAGRVRIEITDVSDELGRPSYIISRID